MDQTLTAADLALLGLLAERPRHPYELELVIEERGVREWTSLGFSSIYYVLDRLERRGLVTSERIGDRARGRRTYTLTESGWTACRDGTVSAIKIPVPSHDPVLVGLANSPLLSRDELVATLRARRDAVADRRAAVMAIRDRRQPRAVFVAAIFDHGLAMLSAELAWVDALIVRIEEES
jgi:DNA-binding PadR family transcriptional regulator